MMMCTSSDTSSKDPATISSLSAANSKPMTSSIKFEEKPNPSDNNQINSNHRPHRDTAGKTKEHANGNGIVAIKEESENSQEIEKEEDEQTGEPIENNIEQTEGLEYTFKPYSQDDSCDYNPEFPVICSFIIQFGDKLDLTLNIEQLKSSIEDQTRVDDSLIELHVKLLKKVRRYFVRDLWEKALIRYVSQYSYEDAYEIEYFGYQKTRPSIKLQLLRRLMDAQFEHDQKFKPTVNLCEADELRILPTGRDIHGNTYWHHSDSEGYLRVYQEQPLDYKSWKTICSSSTELKDLIEKLEKDKDDSVKGEPILEPYDPLPEIFPELFIKEEKIEEEEPQAIERKTSKTKKGRGNRGRCGKKNNLPALKEMETEKDVDDEEEEEENINSGLKANDLIGHQADNKSTTHNGRTDSKEPSESTSQCTIESQVKWTLENLISKVVTSFEYIIRPLSRNSIGRQTKEETLKEEATPIKAPKKRATKRDKPREEVLPRRTSSRIQQIQQKKQAEQEEEIKKMIESNAAKKTNSVASSLVDDDSRSRSSRTNRKRSESPVEDSKKNNNKKRRRKGQSWKRGKGKKKLSWDKDDSDLSSTSSVTESNEDDDELDFQESTFEIETNDFDDDEFACEDEETNIEPVIIKRARTARQNLVHYDNQGDPNESSIVEEDKPCRRCDKSNDPDWILLCDMCDDGYHTSCCLPPLMIVPDGDWFCPPCEHKMLLTKLQEFRLVIEEKERERKKAERIRQIHAKQTKKEPIKIEPMVVETADAKRQRDILNELSDPLALQELDDEIAQFENDGESSESSYERKKPPRNRTKKRGGRAAKRSTNKRPVAEDDDDDEEELDFSVGYNKKRRTSARRRNVSDEEDDDESEMEQTSDEEEEEEEEQPDVKQKTRRARACVSYRFQEYDELIKSAIQSDTYGVEEEEAAEDKDDDDEASERESSPDNGTYGRGKDMATIEALAYQQENGMIEQNSITATAAPALTTVGNTETLPAQTQSADKKPRRKKSRRLNDLDAASESGNTTSDESFQASSATEADEDEDDDLTEAGISDESETSIDELVASHHVRSRNKKQQSKKRKKRRGSYESDDSDYQPTRSRRAASKRVSYKESTEDEEEEEMVASAKKSKKKDTLSSGDESEVSWRGEGSVTANEEEEEEVEDEAEAEEGEEEEDDKEMADDRSTSCSAESAEMDTNLVIHEEVERTAKVTSTATTTTTTSTATCLPARLDMKQTTTTTTTTTIPNRQPILVKPIPPVPVAPILETLQPPASRVVVVKKAKIEPNLSATSLTLPNTSVIITSNCSTVNLDDSLDEIAAPFYTTLKPPASMPQLPSHHAQQQRPTPYQNHHATTATTAAAAAAPIVGSASYRPEQQPSRVIAAGDKGRDPIRELIQYCNESANSATMFDSFNQTLSTQKNQPAANASPAHPPFYEDDDLK